VEDGWKGWRKGGGKGQPAALKRMGSCRKGKAQLTSKWWWGLSRTLCGHFELVRILKSDLLNLESCTS
jgi:hypothetical protein